MLNIADFEGSGDMPTESNEHWKLSTTQALYRQKLDPWRTFLSLTE